MPKKKKKQKAKKKSSKKRKVIKRKVVKKISRNKKKPSKNKNKNDTTLSQELIIKTKPEWIKSGLVKNLNTKINIMSLSKTIIHFGKKKEREFLG